MKALILKINSNVSFGIDYAKKIEDKLKIPVIPLFNGMELKTIDADNLDVYIAELQNLKKYNDSTDFITKDNIDDLYDYLRDYWCDTVPFKSMSDEDFEKYIENYVNNLEWKKAIFIWVETPDNV